MASRVPDTSHQTTSHLARLRTVTLGCKVNQYETEFVRQALTGIGFRDAQHGENAELCIVNTCTVTHEGDPRAGRRSVSLPPAIPARASW